MLVSWQGYCAQVFQDVTLEGNWVTGATIYPILFLPTACQSTIFSK